MKEDKHNNQQNETNRPNRLMSVLPISSHVTILLGSFSFTLLSALMAQFWMARSMLEKSKDLLSGD